ncbi:hypothetical protein ES703_115343 [subsurface metagenome]
MKLNKSIIILLSVILFFIVAILLNSLIVTSQDLRASSLPEYHEYLVVNVGQTFGTHIQVTKLMIFMNKRAEQGWRLHTFSSEIIIFERRYNPASS